MNYSELVTNIRNYSEVGSNVFTDAVIDNFITFAENRILRPFRTPAREAKSQRL